MAINKIRNETGGPSGYQGEWSGFGVDLSTGALKLVAKDTIIPQRAIELFVKVPLSGTAIHTASTNWQNPELGSIMITRVVLNITTASTGASTLDIGYTPTSATTTSDTFLDGVSGTPAAVFDSADAGLDSGANDAAQIAAAGKWVTFNQATGDTTGLIGNAYIFYYAL